MKKEYRNDWITFCPYFQKASFTIAPASYFDDRFYLSFDLSLLLSIIATIILCLTGNAIFALLLIPFIFIGWGHIYLNLPFHSGIYECDPPEYGFYFYGEGSRLMFDTFWLRTGNDVKCFHMAWEWGWVRTSYLLKDGKSWVHETKGNSQYFWKRGWDDRLFYETHPYKYTLKNGEEHNVNATIKVEQIEWRWRWFKWSPFPRMVKTFIDISFDDEIGSEKGSWKGGVIGCSYTLLPTETPLECLRRMEKERRFDK